jgi:iron complex outermembrane receptor protein
VPTRLERDIAIEITPPGSNPVGRLLGNHDFAAERLIAYELGYRWQATRSLSFDTAFFYNDYDRLASLEFGTPYTGADGRTVIPIVNENLTAGNALGAEVAVDWAPTRDWHLTANYSWLELSLTPSGADLNRGEWAEGSTPRNMAGLRSSWTLGDAFEIDAQYRYQSRIHTIPVVVTGEGIDAYSELDLRLGWRVNEHWELSLLGQNLLHDDHMEFGDVASAGRLERAAYLKINWRN